MATSVKAVNKYNKKTYKNWSIRLKPELYEELVNFCTENNMSHSQFIRASLEASKNPK